MRIGLPFKAIYSHQLKTSGITAPCSGLAIMREFVRFANNVLFVGTESGPVWLSAFIVLAEGPDYHTQQSQKRRCRP